MCGRFVSASPPDEIAKYFDVDAVAETVLEPSFNVAPTNQVYTVLQTGEVRALDIFRWGLVPFWAKDIKIGSKMINARAETVAEKPAFRTPLKKKRCIIPVDGFYEWKAAAEGQKQKQPLYIHRPDGEPLAFAGLWEVWSPKPAKAGEGDDVSSSPVPDTKRGEVAGGAELEEVRSCTIITTTANKTMEPFHNRMPVILPPSAWDEWLDPENHDVESLGKLLVPAPAKLITVEFVSTAVNNVRNKGPELIEPVDPGDPAS